MIGNRLARAVHWTCRGAAGICGVCIVLVGAFLKADAKEAAQTWVLAGEAIAWVQGHAWVLLLSLPVAAGLLCWAWRTVAAKWLNPGVRELLEQIRTYAFRSTAGQPVDHHRITLFRTGWSFRGRVLRIVERTGHLTRKHRTRFRIPGNLDKCEGVAGRTWGLQQVLSVDNLPDVSHNPTPADVASYARSTYVAEGWVRSKRPTARSFLGIPIEVNGLRWGVLVIDSAQPSNIRVTQSAQQHYYPLAAVALAKLLERRQP